MMTIDGSQGEGGGQILRTSLALSLVTGQSIRMVNIRAGRKKPGLMRQHLTAVEAATEIGQATASGAIIGSRELRFTPKEIRAGEYRFAVGTAGSTTLVLQAVLPALWTASGPSTLTLEGGTHNPYAPPFDFLKRSFLPLVARVGSRIDARLERPGFYPAGGGKMVVTIEPAAKLTGFDLNERGDIKRCQAKAVVANLPRRIAERELAVIRQRLEWPDDCLTVEEAAGSRGPGNVVSIEIEGEHVTEVVTSFGQKGVKAETVAERAIQAVGQYLAADVPVGRNLADQLLIPLALAGGGSFITLTPSQHTKTNADVLQRFLDVRIELTSRGKQQWLVQVS